MNRSAGKADGKEYYFTLLARGWGWGGPLGTYADAGIARQRQSGPSLRSKPTKQDGKLECLIQICCRLQFLEVRVPQTLQLLYPTVARQLQWPEFSRMFREVDHHFACVQPRFY
jgi:hypothetical protein